MVIEINSGPGSMYVKRFEIGQEEARLGIEILRAFPPVARGNEVFVVIIDKNHGYRMSAWLTIEEIEAILVSAHMVLKEIEEEENG